MSHQISVKVGNGQGSSHGSNPPEGLGDWRAQPLSMVVAIVMRKWSRWLPTMKEGRGYPEAERGW